MGGMNFAGGVYHQSPPPSSEISTASLKLSRQSVESIPTLSAAQLLSLISTTNPRPAALPQTVGFGGSRLTTFVGSRRWTVGACRLRGVRRTGRRTGQRAADRYHRLQQKQSGQPHRPAPCFNHQHAREKTDHGMRQTVACDMGGAGGCIRHQGLSPREGTATGVLILHTGLADAASPFSVIRPQTIGSMQWGSASGCSIEARSTLGSACRGQSPPAWLG